MLGIWGSGDCYSGVSKSFIQNLRVQETVECWTIPGREVNDMLGHVYGTPLLVVGHTM